MQRYIQYNGKLKKIQEKPKKPAENACIPTENMLLYRTVMQNHILAIRAKNEWPETTRR